MRYLHQQLTRIRTSVLVAFVAFADAALFLGVVPFELYSRSLLLQHRGDVPFLLSLLAANAMFIVFLFAAMAAAGVLFGRGARRAARVTAPVIRKLMK
jgi:hypothetical protein